jgi:hypothetical protein
MDLLFQQTICVRHALVLAQVGPKSFPRRYRHCRDTNVTSQSRDDGIYGQGHNLVRPDGGSRSGYIGTQADVVFKY